MSLEDHLREPVGAWTAGTGRMHDVVVSSRARIARNLEGFAFPERLSPEQRELVVSNVQVATGRLDGTWEFYRLSEVAPVDRQVLLEKHLISPQQLGAPDGAALALRSDEAVSVMVNEEDHLRLQAIQPGLAVREALAEVGRADDQLESALDFAFSADLGYLTACPTNVGTGIRLSVMLHLGGLMETQAIAQLLHVLPKLGLAVRGLYGEGTQAVGNLFQVSNQITLGQAEEEVAAGVERAALQIIEQERAARRQLAEQQLPMLQDRVHRAYGILQHARMLSAEEAMRLLSDIRLGTEMGILKLPLSLINELLLTGLPGFLTRAVGQQLPPLERRQQRATLIRQRLAREDV